MREMRGAVAHRQTLGHADAGQRLALEGEGVEILADLGAVHLQVDDGAGEVLHRLGPLVEGLRPAHGVEQGIGDRRVRLHVPGEIAQERRFHEPVFVELRGQFHEIAGDRGAGDSRVGDVGHQPVQRMAEFVEQGAGVVEGEHRVVPLGGLREVHRVDDDGAHLLVVAVAAEFVLAAKAAHPRAGAFRGPREVVADEDADMRAVRPAHLPHSRVWMVARGVRQFREG